MDKKPWTSKTFWFFLLYLVLNVAGLLGYAEFMPTDDQAEIVGIIVAAAGLILRFLTNRGVSLRA